MELDLDKDHPTPLVCEAQMMWYRKNINTIKYIAQCHNITIDQAIEIEKLRQYNFMTQAFDKIKEELATCNKVANNLRIKKDKRYKEAN